MRFAALALLLLSLSAHADENILPREELLRQGYQPVPLQTKSIADTLPLAHALPWPTDFQDAAHTVANSMAQYQPFDDPAYFHGGCDLRTKAGAETRAPIAGKLEAGHYGYVTNADGSMTKYWKPWPEHGDEIYFEVAVVGDDGTRYELHHINRSTLPAAIVKMLNAGGGRVEAGTPLGYVIYWPGGDYHHTHYNIVLPSGVRVNPEFASPLVPDALAPEILNAFAVAADGRALAFGNGSFRVAPKEFVVKVVDRLDQSVYEHPPAFARLKFASGEETAWDFRTTLTAPGGKFPPLTNFFMEKLRGPDGRWEYTEGGYGTGHSLIRLAVPAGARGPFEIEMADLAGNIARKTGTIVP